MASWRRAATACFRLGATAKGTGLSSRVLRKSAVGQVFARTLTQSSSAAPKTIQHVLKELYGQVDGQKVWKPDQYDRSHLLGILPTSQDQLPPRSMSDSYDEVLIPLGDEETLRDKYINYMGGVRFGRILEDMDVFAVWLCYRYVLNPKQAPGASSPFCIVTALVDRIDLANSTLKANENIKFTGHVSWVGTTSLEATIQVQQLRQGEWEQLINARFVMVARDPLNRGSAIVNPIQLNSEDERVIFLQGEENNKRRKQLANESLLKLPPTEQERALIHELFLSTLDHKSHSFSARVKPENSEWMENAKLKNLVICHPEDRNRFNKIFGGYLMRQAVELANSVAFVHSHIRPFIEHVDDIWFRKPVEIGSLLYFSAQVVYTEGPRVQVRVNANVMDPVAGTQDTTNVFHFTFNSRAGDVKRVLPKTYSESMLYLDGKRHYDEVVL